ncbi:recombinase family protein [Pedobacter sp. WC2423]|uniref:recombinase family protein n=1 Tax=Pedobacter sp. WC2423 TaxID=3234142 RepID=UPI003466B74F
MKKAIRYLRFSNLGQSNGSIERQKIYTDQWLKNHDVELVDSFIDNGKTAKNFDRPDFIKLQEFVVKHHKRVDYLVVDQFDRFSRIAGEALSMVKELQKKYGIQIVSVTEGITFDYDTPGSFFRAGLQLLLAEEDNINRSIKVRGGIYTAKTEGRYLSRVAPFGYRKVGENKERQLVIDEQEAKIVIFIFDSFLKDVPLKKIQELARQMGYDRKGNVAMAKVLSNPVYAGLIYVIPFKEYPGGLFPGLHEPLIDDVTWRLVQSKLKKPIVHKTIIDDSLPLRGLLKCHCGNPLTGAPSRGKLGNYFYYYKCRFSGHNNISAIKSHDQLLGAWELMSLSKNQIKEIRVGSQKSIEHEIAVNAKTVNSKKQLLEAEQEKLFALEEKWIRSDISKETYDRWHLSYNSEYK